MHEKYSTQMGVLRHTAQSTMYGSPDMPPRAVFSIHMHVDALSVTYGSSTNEREGRDICHTCPLPVGLKQC